MKKFGTSIFNTLHAAEKKLEEQERTSKEEELSGKLKDLPENHPLRNNNSGKDLADLPPGHPMLKDLERAKQSYELLKQAKDKTVIRRAQRLEQIKTADRKVKQEELIDVSKGLNSRIENLSKQVMEAVQYLDGSLDKFENKPILKIRAQRLKQLLLAMNRGLMDGAIKPIQTRLED